MKRLSSTHENGWCGEKQISLSVQSFTLTLSLRQRHDELFKEKKLSTGMTIFTDEKKVFLAKFSMIEKGGCFQHDRHPFVGPWEGSTNLRWCLFGYELFFSRESFVESNFSLQPNECTWKPYALLHNFQ
jgi:hypothetical protein